MRRHSYPLSHGYPESYYDDQLCLKPPLLLWLAVFYLSRAITLPVAMAMAHFAGVESNAIAYFRGFWSFDALVPSAIAALILFTLFRRVPSAPKWVRWIWTRGRVFLAISAILDVVLSLIAFAHNGAADNQSLFSLIAAAIDVYFLVYILWARRVRHVFEEFPPPLRP